MSDVSENDNQSSFQMVEEIGRHRWVWRLLAVFFFIPSFLYIQFGPEKRFKNALKTGDVEAARDALSSMRLATLIGTLIGVVILALHIMDSDII